MSKPIHTVSFILSIFASPVLRNDDLGYEYLVGTQLLIWEDARQQCFQRGFYLAWIESEQENIFVHNLRISCENL